MFDSILQRVKKFGRFWVHPTDVAASSNAGRITVMDAAKEFSPKRLSRRANPLAANMADYVNWVIYDRISFAAAATVPNKFSLFVIPAGSGSKTKVDTNLTRVSQLDGEQWMNVTGIAIWVNPNVLPADLESFLNTTYIDFFVGPNKDYITGPVQCFPGAGGIYGAVGTTTANSMYAFENGWPSVHNLYDLRLPAGILLGKDPNTGGQVLTDGFTGITILQNQTFHLDFLADAGGAVLAGGGATPPGTGLTVGAYLHGILSRGVF